MLSFSNSHLPFYDLVETKKPSSCVRSSNQMYCAILSQFEMAAYVGWSVQNRLINNAKRTMALASNVVVAVHALMFLTCCLFYITVFSSVNSLAQSTLPVSLFFWGWALKNTMGFQKQIAQAEAKGKKAKVPGLDLGVVSFLTSALSSTFLLGTGDNAVLSSSSSMLVTGSFVFVSINYALGCALMMKVKPKVALYCGIFTGIWAALAYNVNGLMKVWSFLKKIEREAASWLHYIYYRRRYSTCDFGSILLLTTTVHGGNDAFELEYIEIKPSKVWLESSYFEMSNVLDNCSVSTEDSEWNVYSFEPYVKLSIRLEASSSPVERRLTLDLQTNI